jgi:hypothetical protein
MAEAAPASANAEASGSCQNVPWLTILRLCGAALGIAIAIIAILDLFQLSGLEPKELMLDIYNVIFGMFIYFIVLVRCECVCVRVLCVVCVCMTKCNSYLV